MVPPVPIGNVDAFLSAIGQWNLFDMEVRRLRYEGERVGTGTLELYLYLGVSNVRRVEPQAAATEYEFVFRFDGAEGLFVDDFAGSIIGDYEFTSHVAPDGRPYIEVSLSSISAGDIRFLCTAITVVSARELPAPAV